MAPVASKIAAAVGKKEAGAVAMLVSRSDLPVTVFPQGKKYPHIYGLSVFGNPGNGLFLT